jgi:hypothetical protein
MLIQHRQISVAHHDLYKALTERPNIIDSHIYYSQTFATTRGKNTALFHQSCGQKAGQVTDKSPM